MLKPDIKSIVAKFKKRLSGKFPLLRKVKLASTIEDYGVIIELLNLTDDEFKIAWENIQKISGLAFSLGISGLIIYPYKLSTVEVRFDRISPNLEAETVAAFDALEESIKEIEDKVFGGSYADN